MTHSQNARIRAHLLRGKSLTALEALTRFGTFRLAARILELKHDEGLPIRTSIEKAGGKRIAVYRITA